MLVNNSFHLFKILINFFTPTLIAGFLFFTLTLGIILFALGVTSFVIVTYWPLVNQYMADIGNIVKEGVRLQFQQQALPQPINKKDPQLPSPINNYYIQQQFNQPNVNLNLTPVRPPSVPRQPSVEPLRRSFSRESTPARSLSRPPSRSRSRSISQAPSALSSVHEPDSDYTLESDSSPESVASLLSAIALRTRSRNNSNN